VNRSVIKTWFLEKAQTFEKLISFLVYSFTPFNAWYFVQNNEDL